MKTPRHILVIRLSAMGDVAISVPVLYAFAKANPEVQLTVLTKSNFVSIINTLPNVNVFIADVKGKHHWRNGGLWRLAQELKKEGIDAIADLHNVLRSKILRLFLQLPAAIIHKDRKAKKALTRTKSKVLKPLRTSVNRYIDVFVQLGFSPFEAQALPRPNRSDTVAQFMGETGKKWVGIAPFAAHSGKQYPEALMKTVLEQLDTVNGIQLVLFGAPAEAEALKALSANCQNSSIAAGKLNLKEEINLIAQLDIMLAMDSSNAHLAAMYGVPTVTLWGVTHPYAGFAPFQQEAHCLLSDRTQYPDIPTSVYGKKVPLGYETVMETILPTGVVAKVVSLL